VNGLAGRRWRKRRNGSDFASEEELGKLKLTETATRILKKAFAMERERRH